LDQRFRFLERFKIHAWRVLGLFFRLSAITSTGGTTLPRRAFYARVLAHSAVHRGPVSLAARCCCHAGPTSWPPLLPCRVDVPSRCCRCRALLLLAQPSAAATYPTRCSHRTSRRRHCRRITASLSPTTVPRCAFGPPGHYARRALATSYRPLLSSSQVGRHRSQTINSMQRL